MVEKIITSNSVYRFVAFYGNLSPFEQYFFCTLIAVIIFIILIFIIRFLFAIFTKYENIDYNKYDKLWYATLFPASDSYNQDFLYYSEPESITRHSRFKAIFIIILSSCIFLLLSSILSMHYILPYVHDTPELLKCLILAFFPLVLFTVLFFILSLLFIVYKKAREILISKCSLTSIHPLRIRKTQHRRKNNGK